MDEFIQGTKGLRIYYQQRIPSNPAAWVLIVHGWGEHSGRYSHVTEKLLASGFAVALYDHRGHGKSEGLRSYVNTFSEYVDDLAIVCEKVLQVAAPMPVFILAQSMGALVCAQYCIQYHPPLQGVILSAALLKVRSDFSPFLQKLSGVVSALLPKLATVKLDNTLLSRDPAVIETVQKDPLHYKGGVRARTGAEIMKATKWVQAHAKEFTLPVLLVYGDVDKIVDQQGSRDFYAHSGSSDKEFKSYPSAFHEIMNEINKDEVLRDIITWLTARSGDV